MQHTWTYKPLMQDVLGMSLNRVTLDPEPSASQALLQPGASSKKTYEVGYRAAAEKGRRVGGQVLKGLSVRKGCFSKGELHVCSLWRVHPAARCFVVICLPQGLSHPSFHRLSPHASDAQAV